MTSSSLTAGMLAGLTGEGAARASGSSADSAAPPPGRASSASEPGHDMSAELRFAAVNWDRKKRAPNVNPRKNVDLPLTAEDRFLAVPWDPSAAPVQAAVQRPVITEDDAKNAEVRSRELSVAGFFNKANW